MTTHSMAAGSDPRRLLAQVRHLARRVRVAQRVTRLPLLVLPVLVVTFGAGFVLGNDVLIPDGVHKIRLLVVDSAADRVGTVTIAVN